jgi:hypothetical protein
MKRILRDERGMALALAIVALVIVGALVAGAFFSGIQEQRAADNSRRVLQAFGTAEEGAYETVDTWNPQTYNRQKVYPNDSVGLPGGWPTTWDTSAKHTGVYGGYVYRFNGEQYLIDITARDMASFTNSAVQSQGGGGRQRIGLLARNRPIQFGVKAALTTGNGDAVGGNSVVNGFDSAPSNWNSCGPTGAPLAGIRAATGDPVTISGNATVSGLPPVMIDTSVHPSTFDQWGGTTYSQLTAQANITLPASNFATSIAPVVTNGACDHTVLTNWGDPLNPTQPCGGYFPIIYISGPGTTIINGTEGQGILLVDGSLSVQGGFQFYGITIIKGSLTTAGGGGSPAHFWGATMVQDTVSVGSNSLSGSANLLYSSCTILQALNATSKGVLARSRSWVPLF